MVNSKTGIFRDCGGPVKKCVEQRGAPKSRTRSGECKEAINRALCLTASTESIQILEELAFGQEMLQP